MFPAVATPVALRVCAEPSGVENVNEAATSRQSISAAKIPPLSLDSLKSKMPHQESEGIADRGQRKVLCAESRGEQHVEQCAGTLAGVDPVTRAGCHASRRHVERHWRGHGIGSTSQQRAS